MWICDYWRELCYMTRVYFLWSTYWANEEIQRSIADADVISEPCYWRVQIFSVKTFLEGPNVKKKRFSKRPVSKKLHWNGTIRATSLDSAQIMFPGRSTLGCFHWWVFRIRKMCDRKKLMCSGSVAAQPTKISSSSWVRQLSECEQEKWEGGGMLEMEVVVESWWCRLRRPSSRRTVDKCWWWQWRPLSS
jgi:hypothetical protein